MIDKTVLFFQSNSWNHDNLKQRGLTEAAQRLGWRVQLVAKAQVSGSALYEILGFWNPLGCIVDCGNRASIPPPADFGTTPVVYLDCQRGLFGDKANYVSHDSAATVALCVRELMSLSLVNFAYVGHFGRQYWSEDRRRQFVDIIAAHGLRHREFAPDIPTGELEFRRGLETFLQKLPRPCGLLAVNDEIGEMVAVAASRLGIHIPDELALVSIDNNPDVCESLSPTLSSADVDFYHSGRLAAELLDRIIRRKLRSFESATFGPTRIVRRASSRPLADHAVATMIEHIRKNALGPLKAGDVAKLCKGSRRNAEKRFRKTVGHSIMDEIHSFRLAKAKNLLSNSSYQVSEIAGMCAYASESCFRKLFKSNTGVSPLAYRKRHGFLRRATPSIVLAV